MKRLFTATCLAASCAVGLAAQSTGTSGTTAQDPQGGGQRAGGGARTVTGCLRAGDTADSYMLTDVTMQGGGGRRGGDPTATGSATTSGTTTGSTTSGTTGSTTSGTTAGGTTAGSATAGGGQNRAQGGPQSIMLTAGSAVDLKAHVGHKIEVVGTMAGGGGRQGGGTAGTTGSTATGTTTGTGTTSTGSTATGTTAGGGTTAGSTATGGGQGRGGNRNMTVTSVRMISESCSQ